MTRLEDRQTLMAEITEACAAGARLVPACSLTGIDVRTFQRWRDEDGQVRADRRPEAVRPQPARARRPRPENQRRSLIGTGQLL